MFMYDHKSSALHFSVAAVLCAVLWCGVEQVFPRKPPPRASQSFIASCLELWSAEGLANSHWVLLHGGAQRL